LLWTTERAFGVDHPILTRRDIQQLFKEHWLGEHFHITMKREQAVGKGSLELMNELAAKDTAQDADRQKKRFAAIATCSATNPAGIVRSYAAAGCDTMDMWMVHQILTPGV
jgi:hypothetical protein